MKVILMLTLLTLSLFASTVKANTTIVTCTKIQNASDSARNLTTIFLAMRGQDVGTVRVALYNSRVRSLVATRLSAQDVPNFTLYSVQGFASPMEVDNQILEGKDGFIRIGELDFSCKL